MNAETVALRVGDRVLLAVQPHDVGTIERIFWDGGHCQLCDDLSDLADDYVPHTGPYAWCRFDVYGEGSYGMHELVSVECYVCQTSGDREKVCPRCLREGRFR